MAPVEIEFCGSWAEKWQSPEIVKNDVRSFDTETHSLTVHCKPDEKDRCSMQVVDRRTELINVQKDGDNGIWLENVEFGGFAFRRFPFHRSSNNTEVVVDGEVVAKVRHSH